MDKAVAGGHCPADGKHLGLDLGDGPCAFDAHLKPGTMLLRAGHTVTRGQQIGEAGNTRTSDDPHLHFHVMDGPSALGFAWRRCDQLTGAGAGAGAARLGGEVVTGPEPLVNW